MDDESNQWLAALAERLKTARISSGVSVRKAATQAGVSLSTLQRAESGTTDTGVAVLRKLAGVYGVSLCDLTDAKPEKKPRGKQ